MAAELIFGMNQQVVITFLFVMAVVFGALRISNVLKSSPASFLLSIAIAAFAAMYAPFMLLLWLILPGLTWFFIVIFLIAFVFEVFGIRKSKQEMRSEAMAVNGAILLVLLTLGWKLSQMFKITIPYIGSTENLVFILGLIFVVSIFWSAMKGEFVTMGSGGGK